MNDVEYTKGLVEMQLTEVKKWQGTDRKDLLDAALVRLDEATKRHQAAIEAAAKPAAPRYYTGTVAEASTGTTHFVNDWNETYCGRYSDDMFVRSGKGRASCGTCCKAGDAALREGFPMNGGSAARR